MGKVLIVGLLSIVLLILISALVGMLAWNAVMPFLFGLPSIDIGQAFALQVLIWTLGLSARATASATTTTK